jgi:ATP-dependent Lon protease
LRHLQPLLQQELQVAKIKSDIDHQVATSFAADQRADYLRRQMRVIQHELGEAEPGGAELENLRAKIESDLLPEAAKQVARRELERLRHMPPTVAEYTVSRLYLDWIVALPWAKSTPDKLDLKEAARILGQQHYGLEKVKKRLLEFLAVIKLRNAVKGPILCFVGPPGVGKTSLGKSIAEALGRKFVRISLGGLSDEAEVRGHRRTYVSALPGRILKSLRDAGCNNPVMMLDELDKMGVDTRGDPASALLEVLDPAQNHAFVDHYLDLPFDLSRVLFVTTANWLEPVHPALRDRLEVIELPGYTEEEKLHIAQGYLVPQQLDEHGLSPKLVRFSDTALRRMIRDYTREAGLRQLNRAIAAVARHVAYKVIQRARRPERICLKVQDLHEYLDSPRFPHESAEAITECGIAIGLAWTPSGGEILFIEATQMPGAGKLILTGSLGDVMKESAQAALSYLRGQSQAYALDGINFDRLDLHVHVPAGATPKDGPSAGLTIVTALASALTRRRVRSDIAMTGEISLRGRVLPVDGIKEKALAAARSGIRQIILPSANRRTWIEVPAEARGRVRPHFVSTIGEALQLALRDLPAKGKRSTRPEFGAA